MQNRVLFNAHSNLQELKSKLSEKYLIVRQFKKMTHQQTKSCHCTYCIPKKRVWAREVGCEVVGKRCLILSAAEAVAADGDDALNRPANHPFINRIIRILKLVSLCE